MLAIDCETTGLDLRHGAKPFMVQTCDDAGEQAWWEWDVDPLTRQPKIPKGDLEEIWDAILDADSVVLQNPKFDVAALQAVFGDRPLDWEWDKTYDTLLAGHLLASNQPHDLTTMALIYLGVNVQPYEDAVKKATNEARRIAKSKYPDWRIAKVGLPEMPSAKGKVWKNDMWLPRAIAKEEKYPKLGNKEYGSAHLWWDVCSTYGNSDSEITIALFKRQRELLKERGLWRIYQERLKLPSIIYKMEDYGVTGNDARRKELYKEYEEETKKAAGICYGLATTYGYDLELPKSSNNKSLTEFIFGKLKLEVVKSSKKTGKPSLDKDVMEHYQATLPRRSRAKLFIDSLLAKRKRDTALAYMEGYQKFWLPLTRKSGASAVTSKYALSEVQSASQWYRLHPSLNPTGTDTLRWSSQNPNEQNISKQKGFNLRYCFGPAPGREWWSLDAENIELRIPAYEAGETEQVELFEKPDEPPFYGSNHLLVFSILHPDKWDHDDPEGLLKAKKKYADTWYQWVKNGNFAVQYGAVEQSGTADRAYHVPGAQRIVARRFLKSAALNKVLIEYAEKHGYVETMPDKTVDPDRGYPLLCRRTNYGKILPTIPLNYHVQGTACWWMMKAMIRCQRYLDELNANPKPTNGGYYMIMQVHDEIVFDFPFIGLDQQFMCSHCRHWWLPGQIEQEGQSGIVHCPKCLGKWNSANLPKIKEIAKLMEQGGDDIGLPTPVSIEYHDKNWSEGVSI